MGWAIALQGGAGDIQLSLPPEKREPREAALRHCLQVGVAALKANLPPLDVVELVVRELENIPYFNAGRGSVLTTEGTVEMEACIMDGNTKKCGAVCGLSTVVNAISLARLVMEKTPHIYLAFDGAEAFAREQVRELENIPCFNAGRGSVLTTEGTVEMEACIMDGNTKKCGAVSGLSTVVNAISLARLVMEKTPHIYLAFDGAEAFAREQGVETADSGNFITPENVERLKQAKQANRVQIDYTQPIHKDAPTEKPTMNGDSQIGTVGCVAVDSNGNLATATSTGGLVNKMVGRIGDTPVIGAGTYANSLCAVSATGKGEAIIRGTVARDVAALMEYKGLSLEEAAAYVIKECTPKGTCGLVAVSAAGEITMPHNTTGMFRACASEDGHSEIAIWSSNPNGMI